MAKRKAARKVIRRSSKPEVVPTAEETFLDELEETAPTPRKTAKKVVKAKPKGKGKTPAKAKPVKREKVTPRKDAKEEADQFWATQAELKEKHHAGTKVKSNPTPKDFTWRPAQGKGVYDGQPGIFQSRDPQSMFKNYPPEYVTDPVTKVLVMARVKSRDGEHGAAGFESIFKITRRKWLKENPKLAEKITGKMGVEIEPQEYYAVFSVDRQMIATSFGSDGKSPADKR